MSANSHPDDPFREPLDHAVTPRGEQKRSLARARALEDRPVRQSPYAVDRDVIPLLHLTSRSDDRVDHQEPGLKRQDFAERCGTCGLRNTSVVSGLELRGIDRRGRGRLG